MSNIPLVCDHCGKVFFDYHGSNWCDCGAKWCSETCAELDGYEKENFGSSCNFCRGEDFEDYELLNFVISALGVNREDLVAFYKESRDQLKKGNLCKFNGRINFSSYTQTVDTVIAGVTLGHMPKIGVINA